MDILKIALLQIAPCGTLEGNLEKGTAFCRRAKEMGTDIALFPEMWSNGYRIYDRPADQWQAEAVSAESDFVNAFGALAQELDMAVGVTFLEAYQGGPRNSMVLFDRFGKRKITYAKVHTCDFDAERNLTPGEGFHTAVLDTACGEVKVGAMICFDREFPESARILMLQGAELILVPNACPMEINRLSQLRARAYENMLAIATCSYPDLAPDCNGGSSVFDGAAYLPELDGSRDTCVLQAGEDEGIYLAELDLGQLRRYRESEVHGNAFRRPRKYGLLLDEAVKPPFVREGRTYREKNSAPAAACHSPQAERGGMGGHTARELSEARRAIDSTLRKCEKALVKLTPGKSQHTLTARRIQAFQIALELIDRELEAAGDMQGPKPPEGTQLP